jgi:DNA-binding NarL/FixJ family response regulator
MKTTVVIVDDHLLIAKALKEIVSSFDEFEVLYECENGVDLQNKITQNKIPNLILLDISMPRMNGFETTLWLKKNHPEVLIMALTMHDDDQSVIQMIRNGAKGYMLKNSHPIALRTALLGLVNNGHYYPDWASNIIFDSLNDSKIKKKINTHLTDREIEFLRHCSTEMSYKDIADKMCCSTRTVETYRDNLCEKLKLKTRVGLAVYALKNDLH